MPSTGLGYLCTNFSILSPVPSTRLNTACSTVHAVIRRKRLVNPKVFGDTNANIILIIKPPNKLDGMNMILLQRTASNVLNCLHMNRWSQTVTVSIARKLALPHTAINTITGHLRRSTLPKNVQSVRVRLQTTTLHTVVLRATLWPKEILKTAILKRGWFLSDQLSRSISSKKEDTDVKYVPSINGPDSPCH
jgi:hypothetical protein